MDSCFVLIWAHPSWHYSLTAWQARLISMAQPRLNKIFLFVPATIATIVEELFPYNPCDRWTSFSVILTIVTIVKPSYGNLSPTRQFSVSSRNTPPQRNSGRWRGVTNQRTVALPRGLYLLMRYPGAYIFQRPFLRGLFSEGLVFGGAYLRREICVSKSIGLAYSWK